MSTFKPSPLKTVLTAGLALGGVVGFFAFVAANVSFSNVGRTLAAQTEFSCNNLQTRSQELEGRLQAQQGFDHEAAQALKDQAIRSEAQLGSASRELLRSYHGAGARIESRDFVLALQEFRSRDATKVIDAAREAAENASGLRLEPRVQAFLLVWWKTGLSQAPADQLLGLDFHDEKAFAEGVARLSRLTPEALVAYLQGTHRVAQEHAEDSYEKRLLTDGAFRTAEWSRWIKRFEEQGCDQNLICRLSPPPAAAIQFAHDYAQADQWDQLGSPKTAGIRKSLDEVHVAVTRACDGRAVSSFR